MRYFAVFVAGSVIEDVRLAGSEQITAGYAVFSVAMSLLGLAIFRMLVSIGDRVLGARG